MADPLPQDVEAVSEEKAENVIEGFRALQEIQETSQIEENIANEESTSQKDDQDGLENAVDVDEPGMSVEEEITEESNEQVAADEHLEESECDPDIGDTPAGRDGEEEAIVADKDEDQSREKSEIAETEGDQDEGQEVLDEENEIQDEDVVETEDSQINEEEEDNSNENAEPENDQGNDLEEEIEAAKENECSQDADAVMNNTIETQEDHSDNAEGDAIPEVETGEGEADETEADEAEAGETEVGDAEVGDAEVGEVEVGEAEVGDAEEDEAEVDEAEADDAGENEAEVDSEYLSNAVSVDQNASSQDEQDHFQETLQSEVENVQEEEEEEELRSGGEQEEDQDVMINSDSNLVQSPDNNGVDMNEITDDVPEEDNKIDSQNENEFDQSSDGKEDNDSQVQNDSSEEGTRHSTDAVDANIGHEKELTESFDLMDSCDSNIDNVDNNQDVLEDGEKEGNEIMETETSEMVSTNISGTADSSPGSTSVTQGEQLNLVENSGDSSLENTKTATELEENSDEIILLTDNEDIEPDKQVTMENENELCLKEESFTVEEKEDFDKQEEKTHKVEEITEEEEQVVLINEDSKTNNVDNELNDEDSHQEILEQNNDISEERETNHIVEEVDIIEEDNSSENVYQPTENVTKEDLKEMTHEDTEITGDEKAEIDNEIVSEGGDNAQDEKDGDNALDENADASVINADPTPDDSEQPMDVDETGDSTLTEMENPEVETTKKIRAIKRNKKVLFTVKKYYRSRYRHKTAIKETSKKRLDGDSNEDQMEVTDELCSTEKVEERVTQEPTESNDTGSTMQSTDTDQSTTQLENDIKKEQEDDDDCLELKIVGVTSANGKEEDFKQDSSNFDLKIDSVTGADQEQPKSDIKPAESKTEESKVVNIKTEQTNEKLEKDTDKADATKKEEDAVSVKEEKKSTPNKPKSSKIQKCIVCGKVGKCKYNIVRNGDVKHLCDDKCFKQFRSNPTSFLKQAEVIKTSQAETPTKNGTQPVNNNQSVSTNVKNMINSATKPAKGGDNYKTCTVCQLMNLRTSKPFLNWQGLDYCGEECLGKFQGNLSITCCYCSSQINQSNKAKFCSRIGNDVKHFCSQTCNTEFVKRIKVCAYCNKDLAQENDSFMAPVGNKGMFKDFCSQSCLIKYEDKHSMDMGVSGELNGSKTAVAPSGNFTCAVCSKVGPVKHELKLDGKVHRLCSDPCFSAFQYANKLTLNCCDSCGTTCSNDGDGPHYVQFEGKQKRFCSFMCVNMFRNQKKKLTPCAWCGAKKSNFDMIERVDSNNRFQLFCSLNCLSLYRVNLQATSNQAVTCDQCRKYVPAQYHLTMSDASVRNFCSYGCVMQFQAQFQTPNNQKQNSAPPKQTQAPAPQQQVTTRSGRVVTRGVKHQPYVDVQQPQQPQQRKEVLPKPNKTNQESFPIISNVVSLAPKGSQQQINIRSPPGVTVTDRQTGKTITTTSSGNQTVQQQIIIQPPPPKTVKNKSMLCKPFVQTKATSCRPHTQTKEVQTEGKPEPEKIFVPVPVPIYCPTPLSMYTVPTPILFPVAVPIPVPVFIPTTKKSSASILKQIKEIQEKIPADPLEAELLMMAEVVAGKEDSSSESEEEEAAAPVPKDMSSTNTGGVLGEDMLQMALRMASEMSDEPVMDLETSLEPVAVNTEPPPAPPAPRIEKEPEPDEDDDEYVPTTRGRRGRGGSKRQTRTNPRRNPKRQRIEVPPSPQYEEPSPSPPPPQAPPPDVNFHLKYTYGVNAFKHWVTQKNAQIDTTSKSGNTRQIKTFKMDILQYTADELNYALCLFVKEVRKPNGEEYAVDSIFYLCLGMQQYLFENGRIDNVFTDMYYERFTECLNELLTRYEPKLNAAGQLVCRIEEEHLWESKQLGAHSPHVLLNTLVYFNTKYFMLKTSEDHLKLSFTHIMKHWKKTASGRGSGVGPNQGRSVYLRYYCPTPQTKENSQKKKKEEMPVYEQTENLDNPLRCPVKLYEFYLSKCPESIKNRNDTFYLVPERSCVPDSPVWYSTAMLGIDAMAKMLNRIRLVREIQEAHLHTQPIYI